MLARLFPPSSGVAGRSWIAALVLGIALALVSVPLYPLMGAAEPYLAFVLAGCVIGSLVASGWEALVASGSLAIVIGALYSVRLSGNSFVAAFNNLRDSERFLRDVIVQYLYGNIVLPLVQASGRHGSDARVVLVVGLFTAALVSLAVRAFLESEVAGRVAGSLFRSSSGFGRKRLGTAMSLAVILLSLFGAQVSASRTIQSEFEKPLKRGEYATDYGVYEHTIQLMAGGQTYYSALQKSIVEDARYLKDPATGYHLLSPTWVRFPLPFAIWSGIYAVAPGAVTLFASLLAVAALAVAGWGMERLVGPGAGPFAVLLAGPYLIMVSIWQSLFLPEWFGSLFVLASFGFLATRRRYLAILFALLAVMTREHLWMWMVILGVALTVEAIREKKWRPVLAWAGGTVLGAVAVGLHWWNVIANHSEHARRGGHRGTGDCRSAGTGSPR